MDVENRIDYRQINLECVVCTETYDDPYLIKCGHVFCKACIDRLQKTECPLCCKQFNKATDLVQNKHLAGVIEGIQNNAAKIFPEAAPQPLPAPQEPPKPVQPVPVQLNPIREMPKREYDCIPLDYENDLKTLYDFIISSPEFPQSFEQISNDLRYYNNYFFALKKNNEIEYLIITKSRNFEPNTLRLISFHSKERRFRDDKFVELLTQFFIPDSHKKNYKEYDKYTFIITQDNFKFLDLFVKACRAANKQFEITPSKGKSLILTVNLAGIFQENCVPEGSFQEILDRNSKAILRINQDNGLDTSDNVYSKDPKRRKRVVYERNERDELCGYLILSQKKRSFRDGETIIQEIRTLKDHQQYIPHLIRNAIILLKQRLKDSYDSSHKVIAFISEGDEPLEDAFDEAIKMLKKETDLFYKFQFSGEFEDGKRKFTLTVSKNKYF